MGIVLDLRNNAGGLLDEAVKMTDDLIDQDPVVMNVSKERLLSVPDELRKAFSLKHRDVAFAKIPGQVTDLPIVILIDSQSASASEVLVGALRLNRAIVIGDPSYGKGCVQSMIPISEGPFEGTILVTTHLFYAPDGVSAQKNRFLPHIQFSDPLMAEALKLREQGKVQFVNGESEQAMAPNNLGNMEALQAPSENIGTILKYIENQKTVEHIKSTCSWDERDCQEELAIEVLRNWHNVI